MIEINEKTIAVWYLVTIENEQDFMGSLFRGEDDRLEFTYRFRYYNSADAWDGKDKKNWYKLEAKDKEKSESYMLETIRTMVKTLSIAAGNKPYDEILMKDGDTTKFMEEFASKPWAHMRQVSDGQKRVGSA